MLRKMILSTIFAGSLASCATISEESCIAGSWESLGYEDGREGESRGHFGKIAETCAKYGITANAAEYRLGYDQGLPLYCSYDRGLSHGEGGSSPKAECREINAVSYLDGYDEGRAIYVVEREYQGLIDVYNDRRVALEGVMRQLYEDDLTDQEYKRLRRLKSDLEDEMDEARIRVRAFERLQGGPKQKLPAPSFDFAAP